MSADPGAEREGSGPLRFYNTLGRRIEAFEPIERDRVTLYTCGPTVYDRPHIGNLRTFLFEDILRRSLRLFGFQVLHVMNITDVEDKIIQGAKEQGVDIRTYTRPHIDRFFEDLDLLAIERAEHYPSATEHVAEMVALIERLLEQGYAYRSEGSVYFSIEKFEQYGKLSGIDLTQVRKGERVAEDEYDKENPRDFVLWKAAKEGEPSWKSPFGDGRPGWHMECSAMSRAYLGDTFDIHCGGVDNIFPHHENEIAQSVCANGVPFVRYWLHAEHLLVDGEKMSKSLGNQYTLGDLLDRGLNLRALRYLFLSVHYRKKLNFTFGAVEAAAAALDRLDRMAMRLAEAEEIDQVVDGCCLRLACSLLEKEFCAALADDLNVSAALGALFTFSHQLNSRVDRGITARERTESHETLAKVDRVLGVLDPARWQAKPADESTVDQPGEGNDEQIELLVERRNVARANRDFAESDRIRDQLNEMGVTLEDGPGGTRWRRGGV